MSGATVIMADTFGKSYDALDGSVQPLVLQFIMKMQRNVDSNGLKLKPPKGARDGRVRTARVTDNYRAVLMHHSARIYYLVAVLPHDEAYEVASGIIFDINKVTGGIEVINLGGLTGTLSGKAAAPASADAPSVFANVSDADFDRLGVNLAVVPVLREIRSEDAILGFVEHLPKLARDVVLCLADGWSVEKVWEQISAPAATNDEVDTTDYEAANERPATKESFVVTGDVAALSRIMTEPLSAWRIFLHPAQRTLAEPRKPYSGAVRVTGGPGTGKTVVALHRVKALADRLPPGQAILLTTYTTTLADLLRSLLEDLGGAQLAARVDVRNIDKVAFSTVKDAIGAKSFHTLNDTEIRNRWEDLAEEQQARWDGRFLDAEWKQVVLAQDIRSRDDYFAASRTGRGRRLNRIERAQIWALVEEFERRLDRDNAVGITQLAAQAARIASGWGDEARPYRHIVVDEAQDLHPAHWKLLRALVPVGSDDLFIVGDAHQRIYDNRTSLRSHGIEIRGGRSKRLTLNYRTTRQILGASLRLLGDDSFDDLDDGTEDLAGYRSVLKGAAPDLVGYPSQAAELQALVERIKGWQQEGVKGDEIAVVARTNSLADAAAQAMSGASIDAVRVQSRQTPAAGSGVHVMTMHRIKGLEYRAVAIIGVGTGHVPQPNAVTPAEDEPLQSRRDLQRERSLLFVAATRAREQLAITWSGQASSFLSPDH
ncbi:UvrD-helicase domain-containing protein [Kitasatospora cineracea]|uniref:UvrD-helicase domain-containing protein n=1 Tax=Kitasatospora cineracea TaxID=88074 RepID=UPI00378D0A4F